MLTWLSLAATLFKLANIFLGMVDRRQVMDAGAAEGAVRAIEAIHAETEEVRTALLAIRDNPAWAAKLRKLADRDG